jgi:hypothetical protein
VEPTWNPTDLTRWLRRRRKVRTGVSVPMGDPDFYNEDGSHVGNEVPIGAIILVLVVIVALLFGGWRLASSGGEEVEIIGSPPATVPDVSTPSGTAPPTGTEAPPTTAQPAGDLVLDGLLGAINLTGFDGEATLELRDLLGDVIDSIIAVSPQFQGREIDIAQTLAMLATVDDAFVLNAFGNTVYPCGDAGPLVVCAADVVEVPAGDMLIVAVEMAGDIVTDSTERSYVYSIVFDSDGDPGNDWVFNPPFDWDYFQGTDRWYQAAYDHTTGIWVTNVTQLTPDGSIPVGGDPSAVRFVVDGPWAVWFIPTSEFAAYPAPFRVSAFGHDGLFSESTRGGDVSGADPTEPLVGPPTEPAFISGS